MSDLCGVHYVDNESRGIVSICTVCLGESNCVFVWFYGFISEALSGLACQARCLFSLGPMMRFVSKRDIEELYHKVLCPTQVPQRIELFVDYTY